MLHKWIATLVNKIEEVEQDKKILKEKNERLEAQVRELQGLPSKPTFDSSDKTSELDSDDDDDDETPNDKMKRKRKKAAQKKRRKKKT